MQLRNLCHKERLISCRMAQNGKASQGRVGVGGEEMRPTKALIGAVKLSQRENSCDRDAPNDADGSSPPCYHPWPAIGSAEACGHPQNSDHTGPDGPRTYLAVLDGADLARGPVLALLCDESASGGVAWGSRLTPVSHRAAREGMLLSGPTLQMACLAANPSSRARSCVGAWPAGVPPLAAPPRTPRPSRQLCPWDGPPRACGFPLIRLCAAAAPYWEFAALSPMHGIVRYHHYKLQYKYLENGKELT